MWGLVAASIWQAVSVYRLEKPEEKHVLWGGLLLSFRRFAAQPAMLALSLLLLVPAVSYFWSFNTFWWASQTRVRLPFLILPWVFVNLPVLTSRQYKLVLYLLVWVMVVLCIGVGINFLLNYSLIIDDLNHGRPVPVPRNHIRFNLLLVTAFFSGVWLLQQRFVWKYTWERTALFVAVIFMFLFVHILSVRSGLVALYLALIFTTGWVIVQTGRWKLGAAALMLIVLIPVIALQTVPSLQKRISYMAYDWKKYRENAGGEYSDAQRWVSLRIGLILWEESPWIGIGVGDMPMEVQRVANDQYPNYSIDPKLPHNQFIYILCGSGLIGLGLSLLAFLAPLSSRRARRFYLFAVFQVIVFVSFIVEYTIETAIGVAFYLFFTLWFMKMPEAETEPATSVQP
jgi:O-antigen ligase